MCRILVVDDHPDTALTFAQLLRRLGHDVLACTTGEEAVALAEAFSPDAALIDVHMPRVDGHDVAKGIRRVAGLENALLVAMTGFGPGDRRRAPEGDFDLLLLKPVSVEDLSLIFSPGLVDRT
jgi:CheY-like chemotaxis protein